MFAWVISKADFILARAGNEGNAIWRFRARRKKKEGGNSCLAALISAAPPAIKVPKEFLTCARRQVAPPPSPRYASHKGGGGGKSLFAARTSILIRKAQSKGAWPFISVERHTAFLFSFLFSWRKSAARLSAATMASDALSPAKKATRSSNEHVSSRPQHTRHPKTWALQIYAAFFARVDNGGIWLWQVRVNIVRDEAILSSVHEKIEWSKGIFYWSEKHVLGRKFYF